VIPIWLASVIALIALLAGLLIGHEVGLSAFRRGGLAVDLTGRHPDPMGLDWQEPPGRVPLSLRTSNVLPIRDEPKDAA
jgi:hypothetical protein